MPKLVYTQAKGVFESGDSLSGVSISDRAVTQESKPVDAVAISYIRLYQQKSSVGDAYEKLDNVLLTIADGDGNIAEFEISALDEPMTNASGNCTEIDIFGQIGNNVAAGGGVGALVTAAINNHASLGGLFAILGSATEGDDPADGAATSTNDYVDITIYAHAVGKPITILTNGPSTHIEHGIIQQPSVGQSLDGGFYYPGSRAEDLAPVQADSDVVIGALSDGTVEGETIFVMNNGAQRTIRFTGKFNSAGTVRTTADLAATRGVKICWNGSAWDMIGYVSGTWTLS